MNLTCNDFIKGLDEICPSEKFIIKQIKPVYGYEKGEKTDNVIGYRYTLVDTDSYETFDVKVEGNRPIVTNEMVTDRDNRIWVALENAIIKPYEMKYGKVKYSIVADSIKVLSE